MRQCEIIPGAAFEIIAAALPSIISLNGGRHAVSIIDIF